MKHPIFLILCKEFYFSGTHPFDLIKTDEAYNRIVELGKELIIEEGLQSFLGFLMENQYYINLWAAMIALESGNLEQNEILKVSEKNTLIDHCIETVERHLSSKTTKEQESNGKNWIEKIRIRYNR